jgi:OmcA/MtrC family decaheme c-type cytochrome
MRIPAIKILLIGFITLGVGLVVAAATESTGIVSEITGVTIGDDKLPVITFALSDSQGNPLALRDAEGISFLIARLEQDPETNLTQYVNYFTREVKGAEYRFQGKMLQPALATANQPTTESGKGKFAEAKPGVFTYTFAQPLDDKYDPKLTHVVGMTMYRGQRTTAANPVYTFVPAGGTPSVTRTISTTETCNACHGQLAAHGGTRQRVEICALCHTPQNVDPETGNTLDLKVLVHKIHSGEHLPSVNEGKPYYIVGRQQNIDDYSTVAWPQDTRNCTTCHVGPNADNFKTAPNNAACTSCHDDVDVSVALNHPGKPKKDSLCAECHTAELMEFDEESIPGVHVIPNKSAQVKGVQLEIVSVSNVVAGGSPTVTFKVTNKTGTPIAPADMDYLGVTIAGPTTDYTTRVTETIFRKPSDKPPVVEDAGGGAFRYQLKFVVPQDAAGTFAFGLEGYVMEEIDGVKDPVRIAGFNPVTYANLSGADPVKRRMVVEQALCNSCHKDLALHGTIRQNTAYCVLCHNPSATDEAQLADTALTPTSINFRVMIHRIHRGEEARQPLKIYGFGKNLIDFGEVRFPNNLAACTTCHAKDTYNNVELLSQRQPTIVMQAGKLVSETLPVQAVCSSCHDSQAAIGHAQLQTAGKVETCEVCHGAGKAFDVARVHE